MARFAHAISSTSVTPAASTINAGCTLIVICSASERTRTSTGPSLAENQVRARTIDAAGERRAFRFDLRDRHAWREAGDRFGEVDHGHRRRALTHRERRVEHHVAAIVT